MNQVFHTGVRAAVAALESQDQAFEVALSMARSRRLLNEESDLIKEQE